MQKSVLLIIISTANHFAQMWKVIFQWLQCRLAIYGQGVLHPSASVTYSGELYCTRWVSGVVSWSSPKFRAQLDPTCCSHNTASTCFLLYVQNNHDTSMHSTVERQFTFTSPKWIHRHKSDSPQTGCTVFKAWEKHKWLTASSAVYSKPRIDKRQSPTKPKA